MRTRYALIFGRGACRHELRRKAAERGLAIAADLAEFLLVTEPGAIVLTGDRTAIVGRLWTSDLRQLGLPDQELERAAAADDLGLLSARYWGNLVLFTTDSEGRPRVYRDPSNSVGAFHCPLDGADLFFSDAEFARDLGFFTDAPPDLRFAVHWLQFPFLKTERAGLERTSEVLAGTWRCSTPGGWVTKLGWNPQDHCSADTTITDRAFAVRRLRETALRTVPQQLRPERAHLQLSGGLDSSIIGACLHAAGKRFAAVHFATSSPDGDERRFASDAAGSCGVELATILEDELEPAFDVAVARSVLPGANPVLAPIERAILDKALADDAALLVDGGGGDNLFCYLATAAPVLDALWYGPRGAARSAVAAVADVTHSTWWEVAKAAARLQLRALARSRRWREDRSYIRGEVLLDQPDSHPWLRAGPLPQGKREHLETIVQIQHFFDRRIDWALPVLHPLMAQPLLELCLAIPSWMWIEGGRDRAVARDAFRDLVPKSVLSRRMKGSLQGFIRRSFERARPALRELLLEGELQRSGILERKAVEAVFADGWDSDAPQLRLSEMASVELWMRSWRG